MYSKIEIENNIEFYLTLKNDPTDQMTLKNGEKILTLEKFLTLKIS